MEVVKSTLSWMMDKYLYVVGVSVIALAIIEMCDVARNKKWKKLMLLIIIFGPVVVVPAYNMRISVELVTEEFSVAKGNIEYLKGESGNIIFKTKEEIEEPVDLRIKDTWIRLVYLTDYAMEDNRKITINYEFGNNDTDNKRVANTGLVFTYKARKRR